MKTRGTREAQQLLLAVPSLDIAAPEPASSAATTPAALSTLYRDASNMMRNLDGLQPQEAFDELLKYLFFKQASESAATAPLLLEAISSRADRAGKPPRHEAKLARHIRSSFARYLDELPGGAGELWSDRKFRLGDAALAKLHDAFARTRLSDTCFDVRAAALRQFLSAELRRGLGIFLTPDAVVRAIVAVAAPPKGARVYDPACGAGTFLIETLRQWNVGGKPSKSSKTVANVYGSDVNARMLVLAELNLGHIAGARFHSQLLDALDGRSRPREWPVRGHFDFIFTNPPFGVYVDASAVDGGLFTTVKAGASKRLQSEVLFIEQCLRFLKPGAMLGIVLPRSVLTNDGLGDARAAIDDMAQLEAVINLPPETFASTGTQTTTAVLFLRRRSSSRTRSGEVMVPVADVDNVGYDGTGRERSGDQLDAVSADLRHAISTGEARGRVRMTALPATRALSSLGKPIARSSSDTRRRLQDVLILAETGRTPARSAYAATGLFVVKVGNLTGQGIDWAPRDRNFVVPSAALDRLALAAGDIVLTSSAHHRKYIAQKVDIIQSIPTFVGGRAAFVAELIRLRVRPGAVEPFALLAFLRSPKTRAAIQEMISGQTAHLRPRDLLELPIPDRLASEELVAILRRESEISRELNLLAGKQRELLGEIG